MYITYRNMLLFNCLKSIVQAFGVVSSYQEFVFERALYYDYCSSSKCHQR
jgi:hypothetical protein